MFSVADDLREIAERVIEDHEDIFPHIDDVKVAYLWSDKAKKSNKKTVYADCEKVKDKFRAISNIDFIITFYEDSKDLPEDKLEILMYHELKHIGVDYDGNRSIVPHDVEDFKDIITEYGVDWIK